VKVGLVSDTHDHVDPRLAELFAGCDLILHAGDVTGEPVLAALATVAPVRTARGNNDRGTFGVGLPELAWVELGALTALVVHQLGARAKLAPPVARALARRRAEIVVYGHSHRPGVELVDGRLFVNPGSAGRRRFSLPRAAGVAEVRGRDVRVRLHDLASPDLAPLVPPFDARL
jgi:putative phosphoesterase